MRGFPYLYGTEHARAVGVLITLVAEPHTHQGTDVCSTVQPSWKTTACALENIVLNLIVTVYFNATLAGVVALFTMHALDELRNF